MKRVAVVGAGGQIGFDVLAVLRDTPLVEAWAVCRNEMTAAHLRLAGFDVRCGSLFEAASAKALLAESDVIINCAYSTGMPARARVENERLLDAVSSVPGKRKIVNFSSVAVYGFCIPSTSSFERPRPNWPYGQERLHLEKYLRRRRRDQEMVILRMGHVYGHGQWLSRTVSAIATEPGRQLPFDGGNASNAVHVRNVAAAIRRLVTDWPGEGTWNLLDQPNSNWRTVFDWHTRALNLPPIPGLSELESERLASRYREQDTTSLFRRGVRESASWLRSAPFALLAAAPSVKQWGLTLLARSKAEWLERRLLMRMSMLGSQRVPDVMPAGQAWMLSDAVPGPQLEYEPLLDGEDSRRLAQWHRGYSEPESLLQWQE